MAATVAWYDDAQTIILVRYALAEGEQPSMTARVDALWQALALAASVTHEVALLVDIRLARILPSGQWLLAFKQLNDDAPANLTLVVGVGSRAPGFFSTLLDIIQRAYGMTARVVFVREMAEAEALLRKWAAGGA